jgi:hypothetical protein
LLTAVTVATVGSFLLVAPAGGQDDGGEDPPVSLTTVKGSVGIGDNLSFLGGEVLDPSGQSVRTFDANQAAVFVQSWISLLFADREPEDPPADATIYNVQINGTWYATTGNQTVYYAETPTAAWVSWPQGQIAATTPTTAPAPEEWVRVTERVREAFQGRGELQQTAGVINATSIPRSSTGAGDSDGSGSDSDSDSDAWLWVTIAGAAVVVGAAVVLVLRRRGSSRPTSASR